MHANPNVTVYPDGETVIHGLGNAPFDWTQRRSVARAFKRKHSAMMSELLRLGIDAKNKSLGK